MEISLIRHGKSKFTDSHRITVNEFNNWVKNYDDKGVFEEDFYPQETLIKIQSANMVMASDLKRSIESAKLLHQAIKITSIPIFRETELPIPLVKGVKLNPSIWALILRCLWFMGYSKDCESIFNAKRRAQKAAQLLIEHAQEHNSIALVGHGFFNMLIAKELLKNGWIGKRKTSSKHWNCTTYYFNT
ncbi:histidine phosphatase family protein [Gracilibacillus sp. S3-1-1]|uniref:Histidine phosphatase family protein n=1 Tax=Gracilibacillus pellucidus TaxID=3095368 RepID=A0ACC6M311_9BACI|nr:histidine phosphatase family protein [Gracilibacillus sp. S3-1-1]MDX8045340.1 histidine phosphatase family protein [Gracilibacillus sp. S3-1-1]